MRTNSEDEVRRDIKVRFELDFIQCAPKRSQKARNASTRGPRRLAAGLCADTLVHIHAADKILVDLQPGAANAWRGPRVYLCWTEFECSVCTCARTDLHVSEQGIGCSALLRTQIPVRPVVEHSVSRPFPDLAP